MSRLPSREAAVHAFRVASEREDLVALAALLHPDVVALVDSGGDLIAPLDVIRGAPTVTAEALAHLAPRPDGVVTEQPVNGVPALVLRRGGRVEAIVSFGFRGRRISHVWVTRSPQKLRRWNHPMQAVVTDADAGRSELVTGGEPRPGGWKEQLMKVVVIGGTGLIGSKVVAMLGEHGHEAVAASPASGVNAYTGEGLADVLRGADAVVDVTNSPSFEADAVLDFFTTSTRHLLDAERAAGVGHHVALSIVGTDRLPDSGYLRAKVAQEQLIVESGQPYSIVRSTQFYEFVKSIADSATVDGVVRLPHELIQPIAAQDAAAAVARTAAGAPLNAIIEIGGPVAYPMDEFIRLGLAAQGDDREVVAAADARYFGAKLQERSLVPGDGAQLSAEPFQDWAARQG